MAISRIDQPERHNHGYYVRVTRNKKTESKYFPDKSSGGKRAALKAARQYEAELLERMPETKMRLKPGPRNTSGVLGVSRGVWEESGRRVAYWQAAWVSSDGKRMNKKFSVSKYGETKARSLAVKTRREGMRARQAEG